MRRHPRWFLQFLVLVGLAAACGSTVEDSTGSATSQPAATVDSPSPGADEGLVLRFGAIRSRTIDPGADGSQLQEVVVGMNQFAIDLYRRASQEQPGNLVLGPYSVTSALGMIYAGAAGETAAEMAKVLHVNVPGDTWHKTLNAYDLTLNARTEGSPTEWRAANKIWVNNGTDLLPSFLDRMTGDYGAPVAEVNFAGDAEAARDTINRWVHRSTNEMIPELFPTGTINPQTVVALVNAVALDAPWEFPLQPRQPSDFTRPDGSIVNVPTMGYDEFLPTAVTDDLQVVELPYAGGALSMVVMVPNDLASFEASLDAPSLSSVLASIKPGGVHLTMPKWSARTHLNLNSALTDLGMPSAFGAADFSAMTGGSGLFLSAVEHEAFIEVDEQGTRAAAATGGAMAASHGPTISVNKPFIYVIRDRGSGAVLFIGRVADPAQS